MDFDLKLLIHFNMYGIWLGELTREAVNVIQANPMLIASIGAPDPPNDEHTNGVEILHEPQSSGWRHFLAIRAAIANHSTSLLSPLTFSSRIFLDIADSRSVLCGGRVRVIRRLSRELLARMM